MTQEMNVRIIAVGIALLTFVGMCIAPPMPFIIDGGIYIEMAKAMNESGSLAIASTGGIENSPPLTKYLTRVNGDLVYPQYPSGYALIAAPFYDIFGIRGLIVLNGLAFLGCAYLVYHIAGRLYRDQFVSVASLAIFVGATFVTNYVTAIWPHMQALLMWLGAIACTMSATESSNPNRRILFLVASGMLIGIGINIRVDSVLIFAVLFVWLRVFSRPTDRLAPLWISVGFLPGLLLAAWLNGVKFGSFTPLSYGTSGGTTQLKSYFGVLAAGGVAFLALWWINLPALACSTYQRLGLRRILMLGAAVISVSIIFAGKFLFDTLFGVYVLVFNLQAHNAYYQAGVEPNEFGQLMFWGHPKRALLQSLPFLPLILIPTFQFFQGKNIKAVSLCVLAIAAPILFYAMNQWHGGGSYNMRYFIPALPFIAILSATALQSLSDVAKPLQRQIVLLVCVGAAVLFVGAQEIGRTTPALYAPLALYPQWVIATIGAGLISAYLSRRNASTARNALLVSIFALAYSALISIENESSHEKARSESYAFTEEIAKAISQDSIILTTLPVLTLHAELNGIAIMVPRENNIKEAIRAANAFAQSGRCVYFHNPIVTNLLGPHMPDGTISKTPSWAGRDVFPGDARMAFFTLASQTTQCHF